MIRIVTGSSADFEPHELKALDVTCIPLSVIFGEKEYKENVNINKDEFYKMLQQNPDSPKTSQPTTAEFLDLFEKFKENGDETVCIFISSKLSGTCQGAVLAKSMCEYENCYIVDSLSATVGENMLVREAVKLRDLGFSAREIYEKLEELKENIKVYACLDTLEYLRRGGRISGASAAVGTVAHIKPIVHVCNKGVVETYAKAVGRRKGIGTLVKTLVDNPHNPDYPVYLVYSYDKENVLLLKDALEKEGFSIPDENIVNIGAVIGTHVGPSAFGFAYIAK